MATKPEPTPEQTPATEPQRDRSLTAIRQRHEDLKTYTRELTRQIGGSDKETTENEADE